MRPLRKKRGEQGPRFPFLTCFTPIWQWFLPSLDFPGISTPKEGDGGRSQNFGFFPLFSLFLGVFPQIQQLKTTNIYYLIVSVGQQSRHSLAGCLWLRVSHKAQSRCQLELWPSQGLYGESVSELTHVAAGSLRSPRAVSQRHQFLAMWASP